MQDWIQEEIKALEELTEAIGNAINAFKEGDTDKAYWVLYDHTGWIEGTLAAVEQNEVEEAMEARNAVDG